MTKATGGPLIAKASCSNVLPKIKNKVLHAQEGENNPPWIGHEGHEDIKPAFSA